MKRRWLWYTDDERDAGEPLPLPTRPRSRPLSLPTAGISLSSGAQADILQRGWCTFGVIRRVLG